MNKGDVDKLEFVDDEDDDDVKDDNDDDVLVIIEFVLREDDNLSIEFIDLKFNDKSFDGNVIF